MKLRKQLEEIQILQCSLIPPEVFILTLSDEDEEEWTRLIRDFTEEGKVPDNRQPNSTCRFQIRIEDVHVSFEIELPRDYPENADPLIYVRGTDLQREEQESWNRIIKERSIALKEEGAEYIVQTLLCIHLIPLLHEEAQASHDNVVSGPLSSSLSSRPSSSSETYHVLFTSHHLISPTKRRNLQKWSSELSLCGFAKVGYPGAIYAEGAKTDVEEFVIRVKAMQWLALKVRFEERLEKDKVGKLRLGDVERSTADRDEQKKGKWVELEEIGEVVDIMRRSGREDYVTDMGLGSSTHK